MKKNITGFLVATALIAGSAGVAEANSAMRIGPVTSQPIGHYEFCQTYPSECHQISDGDRLKLTRAMWKEVVSINDTVNVMVKPRTDMEMWGREEYWSYPTREGDCEDYALEKRLLLMKAGVPASALLVTVVLQPNGDGHAVLTLATDLGDFILDNLEPRVLSWEDTDYRFIKRQSARNSGVWVSINDSRTRTVGSIRR